VRNLFDRTRSFSPRHQLAPPVSCTGLHLYNIKHFKTKQGVYILHIFADAQSKSIRVRLRPEIEDSTFRLVITLEFLWFYFLGSECTLLSMCSACCYSWFSATSLCYRLKPLHGALHYPWLARAADRHVAPHHCALSYRIAPSRSALSYRLGARATIQHVVPKSHFSLRSLFYLVCYIHGDIHGFLAALALVQTLFCFVL